MNTLKIEKLAEKNLLHVLEHCFPNAEIQTQKRLKFDSRTLIVDYYLKLDDVEFIIEFDGPTHYTSVKTQLRDLSLTKYCIINNIKLIRWPYFIQPSSAALHHYFGEFALTAEKVEAEYKDGFYDAKIVLPGDYNEFGWKIFFEQYMKFAADDKFSIMVEIFESLFSRDSKYGSLENILGVDWKSNKTKKDFYKHYPT